MKKPYKGESGGPLGSLVVGKEPRHKMHRYAQFENIIAKVRPSSIVEIGVHGAHRACYMVNEALRYQPEVSYLGFDIFEGGDKAFHEAALNGKGIPLEINARSNLRGFQRKIHKEDMKRRGLEEGSELPFRFNWRLVVGDTRETLTDQEIVADLVFIDGDHRVEAIRSDYEAVRGSRCVVFDDYMFPGPRGKSPDLDVYGANRIVDEIPGARVLPNRDQTRQGWLTAFAVVMRDECAGLS